MFKSFPANIYFQLVVFIWHVISLEGKNSKTRKLIYAWMRRRQGGFVIVASYVYLIYKTNFYRKILQIIMWNIWKKFNKFVYVYAYRPLCSWVSANSQPLCLVYLLYNFIKVIKLLMHILATCIWCLWLHNKFM